MFLLKYFFLFYKYTDYKNAYISQKNQNIKIQYTNLNILS